LNKDENNFSILFIHKIQLWSYYYYYYYYYYEAQGLFRTFEDFEFRAGFFRLLWSGQLYSIGAEAIIDYQGDIVGRDSAHYNALTRIKTFDLILSLKMKMKI
jgi:hypothetical protein